MNKDEIIEALQLHASADYKKNVIRMGIPEAACLGVSVPVIKQLAEKLPKSDESAQELWDTGIHEARLLAVMLWNKKKLSFLDVNRLMGEVISWDLCNYICKHLILKTEYEHYITEWINASYPYKKRAAFILIGTSVIKNKAISDERLDHYLMLIYENASDNHEHVQKGVVYALKEIGKKNFKYNERALLLAYTMLENGSQSQKRIAKEVMKELSKMVQAEVRTRLISSASKMGSFQPEYK